MDKDVVYIHNGILLSRKKSEIMPFVTMWVDLESIMFSEINHPEKDKYSVITYLWNLKKKKKKK